MTEQLPTPAELPIRFCRFCKLETKQLVSPNNDHNRVCIVCWRRQKDGLAVEITDGERFSQPAKRDSRPPTIPPPPSLPQEHAYKTDFNDALRLIELLDARVTTLEHQVAAVRGNSHKHVVYK